MQIRALFCLLIYIQLLSSQQIADSIVRQIVRRLYSVLVGTYFGYWLFNISFPVSFHRLAQDEVN
jgi:hypothetical protein